MPLLLSGILCLVRLDILQPLHLKLPWRLIYWNPTILAKYVLSPHFFVNYVIWLSVVCVWVCVCVRARVRACVRVCACVCDVGCICWWTVHGLACYCCCTVLAFFFFFLFLYSALSSGGSRLISVSLLLLLLSFLLLLIREISAWLVALQRNHVGTGALLCSFNFSLKGHYTRYWGVQELGAQAVESLNTAWVVHKLARSHISRRYGLLYTR